MVFVLMDVPHRAQWGEYDAIPWVAGINNTNHTVILVGVVTQVVLAVNEQGRDRITSMHLGERGRIQVLNAYASNPDVERIEATRHRDGKVRLWVW